MSDATKEAAEAAEVKTSFVVLGVHRRDLLFLLSTEDEEEATKVARDGVLQSKFSDTFVFPVSSHFSESQVNWANPDGVKNVPAQGAQLNPGVKGSEAEKQQEKSAAEKKADEAKAPAEVSKRDNVEAEAAQQIADGTSIDTGQPDKNLANSKGLEAPERQASGGAKSGELSSSDVKGTSTSSSKDSK